ncbi:hypothetical protein ACFLZC_03005 [Patescibacteria group bacterium]
MDVVDIGKLVITTGISLCGRKEESFPELLKLCKKNKKSIKVYDVGDMMGPWLWEHTHRKIPKARILNTEPWMLETITAAVLQEITFNLDKDLQNNDTVVINLHTLFDWRDISITSFQILFFRKLIELGLEPDMFICFLDNAQNILERMENSDQWKDQNFTESEIWKWQGHEVDNTKRWLHLFDEEKEFYAVSAKEPPETLYHLLFEPWRPKMYIQMPISHATPQELEKAGQFIKRVRRHAVVFNPLTIETGVVELKNRDDDEVQVRNNQTVHRDIHWYIPQVDICAAFYVKVVFTAGVVDETVVASQLGKEAWIIFSEDCSPFLPYRATESIFKNPKTFFEFFENEFMPEWVAEWKTRNTIDGIEGET